jgi:hypothetical protein
MLASPALRPRPAGRPARFARPCLEALEARDAPATLTLNVTYGYGKNVTVSGDLTDTSTPGYQLITIQGVVNGQVVTDANGHYSLEATPQYLGSVGARKTDGSSNIATNAVTDMPPVITVLDAIEGAGRMWTIRGTLTYHRPFDTLTVNFGGAPAHINGKTTTASSDGAFTLSVELDGTMNDNGTMWAQAVSVWGLLSERAYETIHQTGT